MANLVLNPTVQYCFQNYVIPIGVVAGCFGTSLGELVFKCWGSALHFEDLLKKGLCIFQSSSDLYISESLNIAADLKLRS